MRNPFERFAFNKPETLGARQGLEFRPWRMRVQKTLPGNTSRAIGASSQQNDRGAVATPGVDRKKKIVFVANCHANHIIDQLRQSEEFVSLFEAHVISSYATGDTAEDIRVIASTLSDADVLVTQSVKNIEHLRDDVLIDHCQKGCELIRLAFWRFNGFWPIAAERYNNSFWYLANEAGANVTFEAYDSMDISSTLIQNHYDSEIEKFAEIDRHSDIRRLEFLLRSIKHQNLFSDHWHPTSFFLYDVAVRILEMLGITTTLPMINNYSINRDRYRLIQGAVASELGLEYDMSILKFHSHNITRRTFYEFSQCVPNFELSGHTEDIARYFEVWRADRDLPITEVNLAPLGAASQSGQSAWSLPNDASRALIGDQTRGFSFHTPVEERPWWRLDLGDHREVSRITVYNRDLAGAAVWARAIPLAVQVSVDGERWVDIANINFPFGARSSQCPLELNFAEPLFFRYLRLSVARNTCLHLDKVEVFSKITGVALEAEFPLLEPF